MQTLYACACDIKSNVGFFPLIIIIIILILSSLLRVVKVVSENKAVTRGPRRRRRRRPGTTKKKEKKIGRRRPVSPKKNEKERFLDMKKTQSFDMRGHTPSKKKKDPSEDVASSPSPFSRRFFTFSPRHSGKERRKKERRRGGLASPPKKGANNPQKKIQSPLCESARDRTSSSLRRTKNDG